MTNPIGNLEQISINTIRTLSMDAVQKANSGHPGTPMALAPLGYCLWQKFLNYDPAHPRWPNRDRFVLSAGHASMLLYSLLHLANVSENGKPSVTLKDIENFRQLNSPTPGHPENHLTPGVETTTGPLGQGFATSVGMAISERWLAQNYNKPGFEIYNYNVYAIGGDGCMMEGVSSEAASLAGHLKLSNLCWFYDSNHITIEGKTGITFDEDVAKRFEGYNWNVLKVTDINDLAQIEKATNSFLNTKDKPTLVIVTSHIGYGAPHKQDTKEAHGEPLGEEEIKLTKKFYGWPEDAKFLVPDGVREGFASGMGKRGTDLQTKWTGLFNQYCEKFPDLGKQISQMQKGELPEGWDKTIPVFKADPKGLATRDSSGQVLNAIAEKVPWLLGGAADLAPSTKTFLKFDKAGTFEANEYGGRNFHFGIREHAMGAAINGMSLSKLRAFGATFLIFCDYQKPAVRLASLMETPSIFIYTHDSLGLGEDGPTHQAIEQLASLRAIPGFITLRPADANEVIESWKTIMGLKTNPAALVLSRQALPTIDREKYHSASGASKGAYVLAGDLKTTPQVIIIGTGSEIQLCLSAYEELKTQKINARVVSMPSWEVFENQTEAYKEEILPKKVLPRVSVEAASVMGWERYVGSSGSIIGMRTFGNSAPTKDLLKHFGFTVEKIVQACKEQL
jgi:transketolase